MTRSRRRLLAASGSLVASLAGCLSWVGDPEPAGPDSQATTVDSPPTGTTGTDSPDVVEVTRTVEREDLRYVEANDTVRYVAAWRTNRSGGTPTRRPVYEYVPFDEWVETECASVAAERVNEALAERLDGATEGVGAGVSYEGGERTVVVYYQTMLNRDGEVISEPSVAYERVQRVAPNRAAVTLTFAGRTRKCDVAVTTRRETVRQA